jgi:iron complex outermembrane recepter protein
MPMRTRLTTKSAAFVALTLTAFTNPLFAQEQSRPLNISPQSLSSGLKALASQAHLQIVSDGIALQGKHTQGIKGTYTNREAIGKLLAGTGLVYTFTANDAVAVRPAQEQQNKAYPTALDGTTLGKVTVEADAYDPDWQNDPYNTDYVLPKATAGTKTNTPVMETPLNVQVISKQVLKDQQVIRLDQALKNVSGVTIGNGNGSASGASNTEQYNLRGFATSTLFRNGFRMDNTSSLLGNGQQFANIESVEVLKGPAAILYGRVEPGGMINLVTKKPRATPYYSLNQQFGSYDLFRTSIDATGPITQKDTLLYRVNASYQSNNSFRDLVENDDKFIAPTLQWNITDRTQATLEMEYQHSLASDDTMLLPFDEINQRFVDLPHQRNLLEKNLIATDGYFGGLNLSHHFNDDWSIKNQVSYKRRDSSNKSPGAIPAFVDIPSRTFSRTPYSLNPQTIETLADSLDLTGHFETFGLKHTLLVGGDYYAQDFANDLTFGGIGFATSDINYDHPAHPGAGMEFDPSLRSVFAQKSDNFGAYLQDQVELPYHIHILGGFRYQYVHSEIQRGGADGVLHADRFGAPQTDDAVTPRVAVLWQPKNWLSLYGNYVENFGANTGRFSYQPGGFGKALPAESAQQWEIGAKTEFFDGRLRISLAYYDLTKQNVAVLDTAHPAGPLGCVNGTNNCFNSAGEVNSSGPELDIQGEILPGWNAIVTYANQDVRITKSDEKTGPTAQGNRLQFVSRNTASVWSTYEIQQGMLQGLKFGGGVTLRDSVVSYYTNSNTGKDATYTSKGYALVGLMAGYSFNIGKSKVSAQLNIDNLLNEHYFTDAYPVAFASYGYANFSTPRTFMGSINVEY